MGTQEDMAWRGAKRTERVQSLPPMPEKKVRLTGYLPKYEEFGVWLVCFVVGGLLLMAFSNMVLPEWHNLENAASCAGDCAISKFSVVVAGCITMIGGLAGLVVGTIGGISTLGIFNENTVTVRMQELRSRN